jgi:tRNA(Leu) C34 or U34 (ribose-2'-O)-methylase TrmL
MSAPRGYFGVAVWKPKTTSNVGTIWRSANVFGASFLAVIAGRYHEQSSDTMKTHRHIPLYTYDTFAEFRAAQPHGCRIVGVELCEGARNVVDYTHPEQAVYLLGPEDGSLSSEILAGCHSRLVIPGTHCLNLAVAGSIILYDRVAKASARPLALTRSA